MRTNAASIVLKAIEGMDEQQIRTLFFAMTLLTTTVLDLLHPGWSRRRLRDTWEISKRLIETGEIYSLATPESLDTAMALLDEVFDHSLQTSDEKTPPGVVIPYSVFAAALTAAVTLDNDSSDVHKEAMLRDLLSSVLAEDEPVTPGDKRAHEAFVKNCIQDVMQALADGQTSH